ncbi:unnamed protein product [Dovyalis caffra]|uniref:Uncharacterized protein n=1 Tax=Dovyalis caffra TaxID=77055 RepID=A0AAV1SBJ4_9ROSI|nr:unnamed protein product [Dovyalis caffra]
MRSHATWIYGNDCSISILGWIDNLCSFAFLHPCNCFMGLKFPKLVIHGALSSFQNIEDTGDPHHGIQVPLILKLFLHLSLDHRF